MSAEFTKSWSGDLGDGLLSAVETELRDAGQDTERRIVKKIDQRGISDLGDLKAQVISEVTRSGRSFILEAGSVADHAIYVLEGTRPHWAPIKPLKDWVSSKLGGGPPNAYQVQWKIAREGTDPRDFLTGPFGLLKRELPERLEDAMQDHID